MSQPYKKATFKITPLTPYREILVAQLGEIGFESFMDTDEGMEAFIPESEFDEVNFGVSSQIELPDVQIDVNVETVAPQNWNAEWEAQFEPIFVEDLCTIVAPFHDEAVVKGEKILISPQMSFGTGHHQTTWLITRALFQDPPKGKRLLDMGCGTGVLAIVGARLGSVGNVGIDIDEWACSNTRDNLGLNDLKNIEVREGGAEQILEQDQFDLILANINRNILMEDMPKYVNALAVGGDIWMSGFFISDVEILQEKAQSIGLKLLGTESKEGWAMAKFHKSA